MNMLKSRYWFVTTTLTVVITFLTTLIIYRQSHNNSVTDTINFESSEYGFSEDSLEVWKVISGKKTGISILSHDFDFQSDKSIIDLEVANFKDAKDFQFYEEFAIDEIEESLVLK